MSPRLFTVYLFLTKIKKRVYSRLSPSGRIIVVFAMLCVVFGVNTKQTMIYQVAALFAMLLLFSFPLSFLCTRTVRIRRILPKTCTAGEKLTYLLRLENTKDTDVSGVIFKEQSAADYPTFEEFNSTHETGEKGRNFFDRKFGYYRWLWLLERNTGAHFEPFTLPRLLPRERAQVEVSLVPTRRGYIEIGGYTTHRLDPLGLFKKEIFTQDIEKLLVLPKMYPVVLPDLTGPRKYHQGGLTPTVSSGESGEFVSLREYRPGDPVKHIDWKVTARVGSSIVRQYQDEYFSRYGILLDTFTDQENIVFEDAVSVAASIIVKQDEARNMIDLLFACDRCISSVVMGAGQSDQHHMLEILSCVTNCHKKDFSNLAELVIAHTSVLSGLILVFVKIDKERKRLIDYLVCMGIPHKSILISDNYADDKDLLQSMALPNVLIFDVKSDTKLVDLT